MRASRDSVPPGWPAITVREAFEKFNQSGHTDASAASACEAMRRTPTPSQLRVRRRGVWRKCCTLCCALWRSGGFRGGFAGIKRNVNPLPLPLLRRAGYGDVKTIFRDASTLP